MALLYALGRFLRLFILLPVLFAIGSAMLVASTAGIFLRSLRVMLLLAPVLLCAFLLAPEPADEPATPQGADGVQPAPDAMVAAQRPASRSLLLGSAR